MLNNGTWLSHKQVSKNGTTFTQNQHSHYFLWHTYSVQCRINLKWRTYENWSTTISYNIQNLLRELTLILHYNQMRKKRGGVCLLVRLFSYTLLLSGNLSTCWKFPRHKICHVSHILQGNIPICYFHQMIYVFIKWIPTFLHCHYHHYFHTSAFLCINMTVSSLMLSSSAALIIFRRVKNLAHKMPLTFPENIT